MIEARYLSVYMDSGQGSRLCRKELSPKKQRMLQICFWATAEYAIDCHMSGELSGIIYIILIELLIGNYKP